jgi:hypothetical protein
VSGRLDPSQFGSLSPPINASCKLPARVYYFTGNPMKLCKHSRYSKVLLVDSRGFLLSLLEIFFHVFILCLFACRGYHRIFIKNMRQ